jgi:hypothetical protein
MEEVDRQRYGVVVRQVAPLGRPSVRARFALAVTVLAGVALAGCGTDTQPTTGAGGQLTFGAPSSAQMAPTGMTAEAVAGESYPFLLYIHCGLQYASFGGRQWEAVEPVPNPTPEQLAAQRWSAVNELAGTMTLVNSNLARFEWQAGPEGWESGTVDFVPIIRETPACA